jgi:hypothetical protein
MSAEITFLFGVHNHQPVGNFASVFKKAFADCYTPFLEALAGHPGVRFSLHFSGPLWEYMQSREKECWAMVRDMVGRGQVELLTGGFYEPVLAAIPEKDRLGQIRMMNAFLEENFRVKPNGLWLTERVWEPHLPGTLARAGIKYTILDEEHFHYAGVKNICLPYITEDEGLPLILFPVSKKLRYLIPFRSIEEVAAHFRELETAQGVAIMGDDGEKFGLWPGTHQWVYKEGWLEAFLSFLEREEVRTLTYSEYLDTRPRLGRVYLPPASYEEMMEWILDPDDHDRYIGLKKQAPAEARRFLRGGFFREFFMKYPESNHLHKRMLLVSKEVGRSGSGGEAARELYQGQCNDAYWHGVFGGLYLPHLREAAYHHLLEAEKKLALPDGWEKVDYDLDGRDEAIFRSPGFNLIFKPSFGGALVELDDRGLSRNLSDVLSRREESYHRQNPEGQEEGKSIHELAKKLPPGSESLLRCDWHPRYSLLDHFLQPQTRLEDFKKIHYGEQGDFVNQEYDIEFQREGIVLSRLGHIWVGDERVPLSLKKRILPLGGGVEFLYDFENLSDLELPLLFGCEWNFYLLAGEWEMIEDSLSLLSGRWKMEYSPPPEIWHFPLETLSQSEEGYDIIRQGVCFLPHWRLNLSRRQKFSLSITWKEGS